jgi:lysophospholipase L1-like esterase
MTICLLALGLAPEPVAPRLRATLCDPGPGRARLEQMERGYYESILDVGRSLDELSTWPVPRSRSAGETVPFDGGPLALAVPDVREFVLKPHFTADLRGAPWTTNAFGMRDRAYKRAKPGGTVRIAFIGDSIGAGWGVGDGEGFESRLERALDARSRELGGPAVEILNFAVPGHAPGQRWEDFLRSGGWSFGPDLVLYEATAADPGWDERRLRGLLARGIGIDASVYRAVLDRIGIEPGAEVETYKRRLRPHRWEILAGVYRAIAAECREHGIPCVWVLVPRVGRPADPVEATRLADLARHAGFHAAIDLCDAYDGVDPAALAIAQDDFHPNADGHDRLARKLERMLAARPEVAGLMAPRSVDPPVDSAILRAEGRR